MPAANGRFGASGGVARPTLECRTATFRSRPNLCGIPRLRQAAGTLAAIWATVQPLTARNENNNETV